MFLKQLFQQAIYLMLLLNRLTWCQPLAPDEEEEHLDNRLKHYIKRLELVIQKNNDNSFSSELQNLRDKFKYYLAKESFKEKSLFLEQHQKNMEFTEFLSLELDKQHINEDLLVEIWYLSEIMPYVEKDLYDEAIKVMRDLKEAYRTEDVEKKYDIYGDIGEYVSDKFLDYFYGEDEPVPLLNAQLKYYLEYLQYLLKECQLGVELETDIRDLMLQVETAKASDNKEQKEQVVNLFDDLTTKLGRYLDEYFLDFKMFKFGE